MESNADKKGSAIILVLSRRKNESIVIDDTIIVTVVEIRGDKVRLGITAGKDIPVHRSEVWAAIQAEKPSQALLNKPA